MVLGILLTACKHHSQFTVADVLKRSPQLEEVLNAYQNDSLKRLAAEFLLENLPYYYSYEEEQIKGHLKVYELYGLGKYSLEEVQDSVRKLYGGWGQFAGLNTISDLDISPDYLIQNIEWAFKVWHEQPWGKNVTFRDFCEYILPYRIKDELLKPWREEIYDKYNPMLDAIRELPEAEDPLFVAQVLLDSVSRDKSYFSSSLGHGPHVGPDVVKWSSGNCRELTDKLVYIFRAVGIPCGCDFMHLRGDGNVAHYWNFVLDKYGDSSTMYEKKKIIPVRDFFGTRSKIYRQTFSLNRSMQEKNRGEIEDLHPSFRYPCFQDVTRMYSGKNTRTFTILKEKYLRNISDNDIVYLCGASHMEWKPLAWAYPAEEGTTYEGVAGGVVFQLAVYESNTLVAITAPFLLSKETGGVYFFETSDEMEEVKLLNKYSQLFESFPQRMVGGVFEGSNRPDFSVKDTLFMVKENPLRLHNVALLDNTKSYRYVRYYGPNNSYCNVSEVGFYEALADTCVLKGKVIGTPNGEDGDQTHDYTNVYDGDPYTSFNYKLPTGGWAGIDLGRPCSIKKIVYTPRNRDNYIRKGDSYELFYSAEGKWVSVDRQIAASDSLLYTVPKGTLLYLKNHTRGIDERIFEYVDGSQKYL